MYGIIGLGNVNAPDLDPSDKSYKRFRDEFLDDDPTHLMKIDAPNKEYR